MINSVCDTLPFMRGTRDVLFMACLGRKIVGLQ